MLQIKLLHNNAKAPTCANPGEDLGYDLYSLGGVFLTMNSTHVERVRTGVSARFVNDFSSRNVGLLIRDRSSMASKGIIVTGGVVDAGYTGEIIVLLTNISGEPHYLPAGSKIAQLIPIPVMTGGRIEVVDDLPQAFRGDNGFGSTGV